MILRLDADGAVVADADDLTAVHVESGLDSDGLRAALAATGTGALAESGAAPGDADTPDVAVLDVAVLRSRAELLTTRADFSQCFEEMMDRSRLTDDGLGLRVPVQRSRLSWREPRGS